VWGQAICLLAFQVHVLLDRVSLRDCHRGFQEVLLSVVARFQCYHDATYHLSVELEGSCRCFDGPDGTRCELVISCFLCLLSLHHFDD